MTNLRYYSLGIDVDKKKLQVCLLAVDDEQESKVKATRKFANTPSGRAALVKWLAGKCKGQQTRLRITLEATGVYHEAISVSLHQSDYGLSVVLPNKARQYMKSLGLRSKTDSIDARGLALMGAQQKLPLWQPLQMEYYELKALSRHKEQIERMLTTTRNQLEALRHTAFPNELISSSLEATIAHLQQQAKVVKKQIEQVVRQSEGELEQQVKVSTSIPGIATLTSAVVLSETNGFTDFANERQVVSYAGYDIVQHQSGERQGKGRISKQGNSHIRRILHLAAWRVVALEVPHFTNLFNRVYARTGEKMMAYVAVQRKILTTIYALVKKNEMFDPNYNTSTTTEVVGDEHPVL